MSDFYVGISKKIITPKLGTLLQGYPKERPATSVHDDLYVGATAIKQNNETLLLFSADLSVIYFDLFEKLKTLINKETGLKPENIIFTTTHTHSGPATISVPGWCDANREYIDNILVSQTVSAAKEAISQLKPAVMGFGQSECYVAINRRQIKDNKVILGQNPDGPFDPKMSAISFKTTDGEYIGTIIHYACHATVCGGHTERGQNLCITRDLPCVMVDAVEEATGAPCIYINGAEGDIGPRLSNGLTGADESFLDEVGSVAAKGAIEAIDSIKEFKAPEMKIHSENISLALSAPLPYDEIDRRIEELGNPAEFGGPRKLKYHTLQTLKAMYENGEKFKTSQEICQTVIALDDLALVPMPFEAFCNIALDLREKSPFAETLLLGMSNYTLTYLPTEDQLPWGGYEVEQFCSTSIPKYIDSLDKEIVKENVRLLEKLK